MGAGTCRGRGGGGGGAGGGGGGGGHRLMIVHGSGNFIYFTVFIVSALQRGVTEIPRHSDSFPVSDMTSESTAFARSLSLKFDFQCSLIHCSQ